MWSQQWVSKEAQKSQLADSGRQMLVKSGGRSLNADGCTSLHCLHFETFLDLGLRLWVVLQVCQSIQNSEACFSCLLWKLIYFVWHLLMWQLHNLQSSFEEWKSLWCLWGICQGQEWMGHLFIVGQNQLALHVIFWHEVQCNCGDHCHVVLNLHGSAWCVNSTCPIQCATFLKWVCKFKICHSSHCQSCHS